jgi:MFS family permease
LAKEKAMLSFGFLMNFFSSYGQTFLVSLYVPFIVESFGISKSGFGTFYSVATLTSAVIISFVGKMIDRVPLRTYSYAVLALVVLCTLLFSVAQSLVVMFVALLGIRLGGQGLFTHISTTATARHFESKRGMALGVTSLGHPAGQLLLPLLFMPMILHWGWRGSMVASAVAATVLLPWVIELTRHHKHALPQGNTSTGTSSLRQADLLRDGAFWLTVVNSLMVPILTTALFLYQIPIGTDKGWSLQWVAFSFGFFAVFNAASMLLAGWLVDKYGSRLLFPLYLMPFLVGVTVMALTNHLWAGPFYMAMAGMSSGLGSPIKTALQVDMYGASSLGTVRSLSSSFLVLSTALGAPLFGYILDHQWGYSTIFWVSALLLVVVILWSFRLRLPNAPVA